MKKITIFILFQFIVVYSFCQPKGSSDYTNSINEYTASIFNLIHNRFKDTINLRRLETGIFTPGGEETSAATSRRLFSGNKYLVFVCTDNRVPGFSLSSYHNVDHKWNLIETVNKDKKEPDAALIGNYEIYTLDVTEDGLYKFAITPNVNKTTRYAIMIFSSKTKSTTTTTTTTPVTANKGSRPFDPVQGGGDPVPNQGTVQQFGIDYYNVCFWDTATSKYGDWGADKPYPCTFELSGDKSVFKQSMSSGEVYKYTVQSTRSDASWNIYEVLDADGKKMTFLLPTDTKRAIFRVRGENKDGATYLIDYHVKS